MSDERLRALERRWKETGLVEDEAALLRERLRAGDLSEAHLRLAGALGSEAAALLFPPRDPLVDLAAPWDRLVVVEDETLRRGAVLRAVAALLQAAGSIGANVRHTLARREIVDAIRRGEDLDPVGQRLPLPIPFEPDDPARIALEVVRLVDHEQGLEATAQDLAYGLEEVAGVDHPTQVATVQAELIPWLLGYQDPPD